jgi:hypothetical protein
VLLQTAARSSVAALSASVDILSRGRPKRIVNRPLECRRLRANRLGDRIPLGRALASLLGVHRTRGAPGLCRRHTVRCPSVEAALAVHEPDVTGGQMPATPGSPRATF